jgi:hypothetical protein
MSDTPSTGAEQGALSVINQIAPLTVQQVLDRVNLIKQIKKAVMVAGIHYGPAFPGSDKDVLLKAGADTLCMTFQMVPTYEVITEPIGEGEHREHSVKCRLSTTRGMLLGEGVGSASTLETKWRFRNDIVSDSVPERYWKTRDPADLGVSVGLEAKKVDGKWCVVRRVEVANIADAFNTALKIAKKRAYVDAVITVTGSSDLFTQDVEENEDQGRTTNGNGHSQDNAEPADGDGQKSGDVMNYQGILEGNWTSGDFFNGQVEGRKFWTKDIKLGKTIASFEDQEVVVRLKRGSKPNSYQLLAIGRAPQSETKGTE